MMDLDELRALAEAVPVRGPWRWDGSVKRPDLRGGSWPSDVRIHGVLDGQWMTAVGFRRCGMQGAQPTFYDRQTVDAAEDIPVYSSDRTSFIDALDHPTARWIVAADPDTVLALIDEVEALRGRERRKPWWRRG